MSMTEEHQLDVLTFEDTAYKPYSLPSGSTAFEAFQPHLEALILDAIYNILRHKDPDRFQYSDNREESYDGAYIAKVVAACRRYNHSAAVQNDETS